MSSTTERQIGELRATMDGRAEATAEALLAQVQAAGHWISSDGRIGEGDLASLIGMTAGALANRRREGTAPPHYTLGGGGHRVTYRITDAARWLEGHRT